MYPLSFQQRHNQHLVVQQSTLQEFLATAEPPNNLSNNEIRELFAADQLLNLGW
jgi:hypothetical protein